MIEKIPRPERGPDELKVMIIDLVSLTTTEVELVKQNIRHSRTDITEGLKALSPGRLDQIRQAELLAAEQDILPSWRMRLLYNLAVLSVATDDIEGAQMSLDRYNNSQILERPDDPHLLTVEHMQALLAVQRPAPEKTRRGLGRIIRRKK
jgi:hypothetical protein